MVPEKFTKGEVDYLIAAPKFIRAIPRIRHLDSRLLMGWKVQSEIFRKSEPCRPIKGLVVIAKAHQAPVGLPHPTPSCALEWHGKRIRGLNYELWHDNPDGTVVKGWHEHVWPPMEQDAHVFEANPTPNRRSLLEILKWGLSKWNIEVQQKQESFNDDSD